MAFRNRVLAHLPRYCAAAWYGSLRISRRLKADCPEPILKKRIHVAERREIICSDRASHASRKRPSCIGAQGGLHPPSINLRWIWARRISRARVECERSKQQRLSPKFRR